MALFNIFNKKKEEKKPVKKVRPAVKAGVKKVQEKKETEKKEVVSQPKTGPVNKPKLSDLAFRILKGPHVTEKATDLTDRNQYVFNVYARANKQEVRKAVEDVYGVNVVSVQIINIPAKKRRLGRTEGVKSGYKKAIVRIREGQKIEILPR